MMNESTNIILTFTVQIVFLYASGHGVIIPIVGIFGNITSFFFFCFVLSSSTLIVDYMIENKNNIFRVEIWLNLFETVYG